MAENKKSSISTKSTCHLLNIKQADRAAKRLKLSFRRTGAVLNVLKTGKSVEASMGLIDLSESGAGFFTNELLLKGSTVEVCITEPRLLKVKGVVAWSVPVQSGVESSRFKFRSGMQFVFENEVQRAAVIEYVQAVNTDPLESVKHSSGPLPAAGLAPEAGSPAAPEPAAAATDSGAPSGSSAPTEAQAEGAPMEATPAAPLAEASSGEAAPAAEAPKVEEAAAVAEAAAEEPKAA